MKNRGLDEDRLKNEVIPKLSEAAKEWEIAYKNDSDIINDFPTHWECHGNLIIVSGRYFKRSIWRSISQENREKFWSTVCQILSSKAKRIAQRIGPTLNNQFRSPSPVDFLYNPFGSTKAEKKENGIMWDVTKCMFSSGNITEKQRIGQLDCKDKVVVDMYAGIGYFTIPYLVHAKAETVYALDWNPHAIEALNENIRLNKVTERCVVKYGDSSDTSICPKDIADHVNLGLIPSSEPGWPAACRSLKRNTGGFLHIHGNVEISVEGQEGMSVSERRRLNYEKWRKDVLVKLEHIFENIEDRPHVKWSCDAEKVFKVKSYGPNIDHCVISVESRPVLRT